MYKQPRESQGMKVDSLS